MFNDAKYIISAVSKEQSPNDNNLPEFVFLGRSNVGKSSFINALTNRKNLARTSSKPGKTIALNYYLIDSRYYFVDVPGYGYASRSMDTRDKFGLYIENYLHNNTNLKIAFLLVDTKVGPTNDDILMYDYLKYLGLNIKIIATKADKVGTTKVLTHKKQIKEKLNISNDDIFMTSVQEKKGIIEVIDLIKSF
jgi:GTP-binding protein